MRIKSIIISLLIPFLFLSCEKSDLKYESEFKDSYDVFQKFKANSNNSYFYIVTGNSYFGYSWETKLTIKSGKVVKREFYFTAFESVQLPANGWTSNELDEILKKKGKEFEEQLKKEGITLLEFLQWTENENNLGKLGSKVGYASQIRTLDEIYKLTETDWIIKRKNAKLYFETKNNGMISLAGYVEDNCQDGCFNGVNIKSIQAI